MFNQTEIDKIVLLIGNADLVIQIHELVHGMPGGIRKESISVSLPPLDRASEYLNTVRVVWAYTDAYGFADLMENLSSHEKPWTDIKRWESIEGEFKFSVACSRLGKVTFEIELSHYGSAEEWALKTQLNTELGQLPRIAKAARAFFGASPS